MHYNITAFHPIHKTDPKGHYVAMLMVFLINQIEKQSMTANGMYYERYSKEGSVPTADIRARIKFCCFKSKHYQNQNNSLITNYYIINY